MDFVDLDKVLDDFEEDEERISVCVVENEANANGYGPAGNSKTYSISISDKYSNVPYPQQVSNEPPTPDSPLYNSVYGVPFKVTDKLTLSDANFGISEKVSENRTENHVDPVKDLPSSTDISPDADSLGQLLQSNGVLEIRDLQLTQAACSSLPSDTQASYPGCYDSVVTSVSLQDSGSVQNQETGTSLSTEDINGTKNQPSDLNHWKTDNDNSVYSRLACPVEEQSHEQEANSNYSDLNQRHIVESTTNGVVCPSLSSTVSCDAAGNNAVVGFGEPTDNLSDADIMAYLDGSDRVMSSSVEPSSETVGHVTPTYLPGSQQEASPEVQVHQMESGSTMNNVVQNSFNTSDVSVEPSYALQMQPENMANTNLATQQIDALLATKDEVKEDFEQPSSLESKPVSDVLTSESEGIVKVSDQGEPILVSSSNSALDSEAPTWEPMALSNSVSEDNENVNSVEQSGYGCVSMIDTADGGTDRTQEDVPTSVDNSEASATNTVNPTQTSTEGVTQALAAPKSSCPGVKPKEPQRLKRPSSLLGLSTVSLQPVINVPKSQSLPRSFALGVTETSNNVKKVNKTLDTVPTNSCPDYSNTVSDSASQQNRDPIAAQVANSSDTIIGNSVAELTSQLSVMPEESPSVSDTGDNDNGAHNMQMSVPQETPPQMWPAQGVPQEAPNISREGRPESLNLPPFLGFPSHLPDTNSMDGPQRSRLTQSTDSTDGPPSYLDLEDSGSDVGAVGGAPAHPRTSLGSVAPVWVPDADAPNCMQCDSRFTFTKRRHHCRACGKVFCSACCNLKCKLEYMGSKEARVCVACHEAILSAQSRSGPADRSPNPNNPSEYCSTIPPHQQANAHTPAPTVLVPVGVLKREGSHRRGEPKQVMFSDGIRPGGDLTEAEGVTEARLPSRSGRKVHKVERTSAASGEGQSAGARMKQVKVTESSRWSSLIPAVGLPPLVVPAAASQDDAIYTNPTDEKVMQQIQSESADPVVFMINPNLQCRVSMVTLDCCVHRQCWCFTSKGLCTVGQDEVVIVLECLPDETALPMDIFHHLQALYEAASKGNTVSDMGHSIFCQSFLGSKDHGGFLYIRPSFQCLLKLALPNSPYVFAILLQKWEIPWAKVFPIRLLLRLGAEYRYYPCPLISIRNRKPVFFEIGHTIMNLLADFRSFQYMLPQVKGLLIHMEDKKTVINFPRNRYQDLMKVVTGSNEHVMALGANFSMEADSHLVCIQNDDGNYQTQAINIQNKPRKVTGASFVVFNGALKTASGLTAKSSIVEDGLMVQIPPDSMAALKQAIKDMKNYSIACGCVGSSKPDEVITIQWVEEDKTVNLGVKSPVDNMSMDGIDSLHIHNGTDYLGENKVIRWTEVFFIQSKDSAKLEPIDLSRLAESLAQAGCIALTPHLDHLHGAGLTKIGLRATIHSDSVGYEAGSKGEKLPDMYMNDLDNELIPVIHNAASLNQEGPITLELIFYILN